MGNLITQNLNFSKESATEYFIKPLFIDNDIRKIISIRTDIKGSEKLDIIDNLQKITKAYAEGSAFTDSTGVTISQRTITTVDLKAQVKQSGQAFEKWVKEAAIKTGVDISNIEGTIFEQIIMSIFIDALKADLRRQMFLGDTLKEIGVTGVADVDYNQYDGFWKQILSNVGGDIPTAQHIVMANSAVKQVDTVTLTGSSGTANIVVNGVTYLATFTTDLTTSASNFVTSYAATIAARELGTVVTSSGAGIIFTSGVEGRPQSISSASNVSGNLAGNVAATTPNTLPADLGTDEAETAFKSMYKAMPPEMKQVKDKLKLLVTSSMYENYLETLENDGTLAAHTAMVDGVQVLKYRGFEVVEMASWDTFIASDLVGYYPHRAMLILPENLIFGTDLESDAENVRVIPDEVNEKTIFRAVYKAGTQYVHKNYIVVAY